MGRDDVMSHGARAPPQLVPATFLEKARPALLWSLTRSTPLPLSCFLSLFAPLKGSIFQLCLSGRHRGAVLAGTLCAGVGSRTCATFWVFVVSILSAVVCTISGGVRGPKTVTHLVHSRRRSHDRTRESRWTQGWTDSTSFYLSMNKSTTNRTDFKAQVDWCT